MTNLDGTSDENLVVDTPAFAASPSTNPCLVYLNMFPRLAADTILIGPHHASAELVENAEGRLIARQAKLSLKLNRRDAGRPGWRPNKPPKTMCSTAYGCVP